VAERLVTWKALADFSKVRKEADKTTASLAALEAQTEKTSAAQKTLGDSNEKLATKERASNAALAKSYTDLNKMRQAETKELTTQEAVKKRADTAATQEIATIEKRVASKKKETAEDAKKAVIVAAAVRASNAMQAAHNQEAIAANSLSNAKAKAATAETNYRKAVEYSNEAATKAGAAIADYGEKSKQASSAVKEYEKSERMASDAKNSAESATRRLTSAHLNHEASLTRVTAASQRFETAQQRAAVAMNAAAGDGGKIGNVLNSAADAFDNFAKGAGNASAVFGLLKFGAMAGGIFELVSAVSALVSGLFALGSAVAPAVGGLAAIGPTAIAGVSGLATLKLAFSGVAQALKAYGTVQANSGVTGAQVANQAIQNAQAIANAQLQVRNAREQVGITARDVAANIAGAEHSVQEAEYSSVESQKALTLARKDALQNIIQLKQAVVDAALAERGASLSLQDAELNLRRVMNDPNSTKLQREQAQLAVDNAKNQVDVQKKAGDQAKVASDKASKAGVEGAQNVIQAKHAEANAVYALAQAQQNYSKSVVDGARQNRQAQEALTQAVQSLGNAERAAAMSAMTNASAHNAFTEAMNKLSPAARAFVNQLIAMKSAYAGLKQTAAAGLLPGVGDMLTRLKSDFPLINSLIGSTATEMGKLARETGVMLTNSKWQDALGKFGQSNVVLLDNMGHSLGFLLDLFRAVSVAAIPLAEKMTAGFRDWVGGMDKAASSASGMQRMTKFFEHSYAVLHQLGQILKNIGQGFFNTGKAATTSGQSMLDSIQAITERWSKWTKSADGQNKMAKYFSEVRDNVHAIMGLLGKLSRIFIDLGANKSLGPIFDSITQKLIPAIQKLFSGANGGKAGKGIADIIGNISDAIGIIGGQGGTLITLVSLLDDMTKALMWFIKFPGVADAILAIAFAFGTFKGLKIAADITKISDLARATSSFVKGAGAVAEGGGIGAKILGGVGRIGVSDKAVSEARAAGLADPVNGLVGFGRGAKKVAVKSGSKIASAGSKVGSLASSGGSALGELAKGASSKVVSGAKAFGSGVIENVGKIGPAMGKMASAVGGAMKSIGTFLMANPWMLLVAGIIIVVVLIITHWKTIKEWTEKIFGAIWNFLKKVWNDISNVFMGAVNFVIGFVKRNWPLILGIILGPIAFAIIMIIKHWDTIKKLFSEGINWVLSFVGKAFGGLVNVFRGPLNAVHDLIFGVLEGIKKIFSGAWEMITGGGSGFVKGFGQIMSGLQDVFMAPVKFVVNTVIDDWLLGNLNKVLDFLGIPKVPLIPKIGGSGGNAGVNQGNSSTKNAGAAGRADGGWSPGTGNSARVPGTGNRDSVNAVLMPGEFVIRKRAAEALGPGVLHHLNRADGVSPMNAVDSPNGMPHFKKGGFFGGIANIGEAAWNNTGGKVVHGVKVAADFAAEIARKGAANMLSGMLSPVRGLMHGTLGKMGGVGKMVSGAGDSLIDSLIEFVRGADGAKSKHDAAQGNTNVGGPQNSIGLDSGQMANAAAISASAKAMGASERDVEIAYMTALVESSIRNLANPSVPESMNLPHQGVGNDHDSVGIFQQRNSWGSAADRLNPTTTTKLFMQRLLGLGNSRLGMTMGQAAQTVQVSAFPDRYAAFQNEAVQIYKAVNADTAVNQGNSATKNKGAAGRADGGYVQKLNQGGIVNGLGPGNASRAIRALHFQENMSDGLTNGAWTPGLQAQVGKHYPRPFGKPGAADANGLIAFINRYNPKDYANLVHGSGHSFVYPEVTYAQNKALFDKKLGKKVHARGFLEAARKVNIGDVQDYQKRLHMTASGAFGADMIGPSDHAMMHALGRPHAADLPHPWAGPVTLAEQEIANQDRSNTLNKEWYGDLQILANWGLPYLVDNLMNKGITDGLDLARSAVKDKNIATQLNSTIQSGLTGFGALSQGDEGTVLKIIAKISSGTAAKPVGLRDVSSLLQMPDYGVVNLYDRMKTQLDSVPAPLMTKFNNDVALFRQGLFYANTGGKVPGTGHSDSVPAMLTPGEFVLKKKAVEALGMGTVHSLNNAENASGNSQFFANGGVVLSPNVRATPQLGSAAMSHPSAHSIISKGGGAGNTYQTILNTEINNPTGENYVYSMNKELQRKAISGEFNRAAAVNGGE
jgi:phage-related protein